MKTKSKIWLGVGAFVVAGTAAAGVGGPLPAAAASGLRGAPALPTGDATPSPVFQTCRHCSTCRPRPGCRRGGRSQGLANLPPDLAFAARIALLRGHLLVGDELVKQQQWNAALPHFLHPD